MKNLIVFGFLILSSSIFAQNEEVNPNAEPVSPEVVIRATIDAMFTVMRTGDSSMVANVFHKDLRLMSSYVTKKGEPKIHFGIQNSDWNTPRCHLGRTNLQRHHSKR